MGISCVADIVRVHGKDRADQVALVEGERRVTWAELYNRSCRMAQAMRTAGVGPGDRVAFLDKNGIEHFEVAFGAALLNAACVDVNWRLAPPEVEYIVNDADAKVFVVGPDFVPVLDAIADQLSSDMKIVVIGGHATATAYDEFFSACDPVDPKIPSAPSDVAFQLYSSGTTGRPKGVMLSNENFFCSAAAHRQRHVWGIGPDSVNLVAMPLFHIGGGGWAMVGLYEGCPSIIANSTPAP
ncbi:MAG: AMP-binding protein [Ilumatobacteraceae bacterium]